MASESGDQQQREFEMAEKAELMQHFEETRWSPEVREQIFAEIPPPEERAKMYRELQEKGGLSFEELMNSVDS